ncbi:MAG: hypothetical protein Q9202_002458 [Teloschistes flavicans]
MSSNIQEQTAKIVNTAERVDEGWIVKAKEAAARESRWQPWKETLQHEDVGTGFEGKDMSRIRARDDVQHSGVAG